MVAEGVEKEAQLEYLAARGCSGAQGYLICPPLPAKEFDRWLRQRTKPARKAPVKAKAKRKVPG